MEATELKSIYGKVIKRLRKARGWSQVELAIEMKYNNGSYISGIEAGTENLSCETICKFMQLFEVGALQMVRLMLVVVLEEMLKQRKKQKATAEKPKTQTPYEREKFSWKE